MHSWGFSQSERRCLELQAGLLVIIARAAAGHVPMLADPAYCNLVHNIGVASLGADEKQIWHLTKLYWFTVEFGVVREGSGVKAFGAGILSSYGELEHMALGGPFCKDTAGSCPVTLSDACP